MSVQLYLSPITFILQQVFTNNGVMAQGGLASIYVAGGTMLATTYTDSTGVVPNANPIELSSAGRIVNANGNAPVSVWAPSGTVLTLQVVDAQGNQLIYIPFMVGINDPSGTSSLQALLASPASSNSAEVGPVAGADLVSNSVKSYAVFSNVRAANVPSLAAGQTLIINVEGAISVGDALGGLFYWDPTSSAVDDGQIILDPTDNSGNGRYIRLSFPQYSITEITQAFEATLSDASSSVTGEVTYTVSNGIATLRTATITFTSTGNTLVMSGLPAAVTPTGAQLIPCYLEDNGNVNLLGLASVSSSGTITFALANTSGVSGKIQTSATGFTSSGTKGLVDISLTYGLN